MKNGVEKRGSRYSYTIRITDPKTGKSKQKKKGGFLTEKDAKIARSKALVALSNGSYVEPSKVTVEEFLKSWLENHSHHLKPLSIRDYRAHIARYIVPAIGKIPLGQIRPTHIEKMYVDLLTSGGAKGSGISPRTVHYTGTILSKAFKYAVEVEGILAFNPVTRVKKPRSKSKRNDPFSPSEMREFLKALADHRLFALFRLGAYTGARRGELVALTWKDIDFENMKLTISKNRVRFDGGDVLQDSTKGGEGKRVITLDPETVEILRAHRKAQLEERLKVGHFWNESGYVFVTEFGNPIYTSTPTALFQKYRLKAGLREQKFHDLRHFHATQLLRAGIPLHVVAQRLGHRDAMVTATIYAHVTNDQLENVPLIFAKAVEN